MDPLSAAESVPLFPDADVVPSRVPVVQSAVLPEMSADEFPDWSAVTAPNPADAVPAAAVFTAKVLLFTRFTEISDRIIAAAAKQRHKSRSLLRSSFSLASFLARALFSHLSNSVPPATPFIL
jgi:hypothetical protein